MTCKLMDISKASSSKSFDRALGSLDYNVIRSFALVPAATAISFPFLPVVVRN